MRKVNPKSDTGNALLLLANSNFIDTTLYLPKADGGEPDVNNVLYAVTNTNKARRITLKRGQRAAEALVAEIHYPSEFRRRKSGSVTFAGREELSFSEWMTRAGKGRGEHQLTIAGEEYMWTHGRRGAVNVYPLLRNGQTVATYVPGGITRGTGERVLTRGYIEFASPKLPEETILDGIIASLVVIQHTIMISRTTDNYVWWFPVDFQFCVLAC